MKHDIEIISGRSSGNTTRCIDAAIQHLFKNGYCYLNEGEYNLTYNNGKLYDEHFRNVVMSRLMMEHHGVQYRIVREDGKFEKLILL